MVHQIRVTFPASSPSFSWGWAHSCPSGHYIVSSFPICPSTEHTGPSSTGLNGLCSEGHFQDQSHFSLKNSVNGGLKILHRNADGASHGVLHCHGPLLGSQNWWSDLVWRTSKNMLIHACTLKHEYPFPLTHDWGKSTGYRIHALGYTGYKNSCCWFVAKQIRE